MLLLCSYKAACARVFSISMITSTTSLTGILSPESCDGNLCCQFLFCGAFFPIDFAGEPACGLIIQHEFDSCVARQRLDTHKHIFLFFFSSHSPTAVSLPLELSINSLLIKNLFRYLRSAFFFSPPSLLWRQCVNHYRGERKTKGWGKAREKKSKKRGLTFTSGRKKKIK